MKTEVRIARKSEDFAGPLHVALWESHERPVAKLSFNLLRRQDWRVHTGEPKPSARSDTSRFMVHIDTPGTVWIDSVSLISAG